MTTPISKLIYFLPSFISGILIGEYIPLKQALFFDLPFSYLIVGSFILLISVVVTRLSVNPRCSFILFALAFFLLGLDVEHRSHNFYQDDTGSIITTEVEVIFRVEDVKRGNESSRLMVRLLGTVDKEKSIDLPDRLVIFYQKKDSLFEEGSTYSAKVRLRRITNKPLEEFNWEKYWANRGIYFNSFLSSDKSVLLLKKGAIPLFNMEEYRRNLLSGLEKDEFTSDSKALLKALVLGNKSELSTELKQSFARSGIMHLLAVSGLHVGIVFLFITGILQLVQYLFRYSFNVIGITVIAVWLYAGVTGFSASVVRASLMLSFYLLSLYMKRRPHGLTLLALSALVALCNDPDLLWNLGFQLSYTAVCGIFLAYPVLRSIFNPSIKVLKYIWSLTALSLVAQISTFPLACYNFGVFPTYFLLGNLVAMPIAALLLGSGLFLSVINSEMIGVHEIAYVLDCLIGYLLSVIHGISALPFSGIEIELTVAQVICIYAVLIAALNLIYHPVRNNLRLTQCVILVSLLILEFY